MNVYKIYDKKTATFIKSRNGRSTWDSLGSARVVIAYRKKQYRKIVDLVIYRYSISLEEQLSPIKEK